MTNLNLYKSDRKLAVLIDPDTHTPDELFDFVSRVKEIQPDYIFIGGSLMLSADMERACEQIRAIINLPLVLFPGNFTHLNDHVDHILLLSLISGRNPDLLIGQHVQAAPRLRELREKLVPTGYLIIDGGKPTSVSYMSNTHPIPYDKPDIAAATAIAGEALGLQVIYMDAGSGAQQRVSEEMIKKVSKSVQVPVIVGGGVREVSHIEACWQAGANLVVVGNGLEEKTALHQEIVNLRRSPQR